MNYELVPYSFLPYSQATRSVDFIYDSCNGDLTISFSSSLCNKVANRSNMFSFSLFLWYVTRNHLAFYYRFLFITRISNLFFDDMLCCCCNNILYFYLAPSFVPRSHGVISSTPSSINKLISHYSVKGNMKTSANSITMMPIGVPKVAYRVPGSSGADWYVSASQQYMLLSFRNDFTTES